MSKFKRIHLVVMDSVGIGEAPDAAQFDDYDVDTLGHIARERGGLNMPNMGKLGLSNIRSIEGCQRPTSRSRITLRCRKPPMARIR